MKTFYNTKFPAVAIERRFNQKNISVQSELSTAVISYSPEKSSGPEIWNMIDREPVVVFIQKSDKCDE